MARLVIFNSTDYQSVVGMNIVKTKYDTTLLDIAGLDDTVGTDEIDDEIENFDDGTFDAAYIFVPVSDLGDVETLNYDSYSKVFDKMTEDAQGAILLSGTAETNATTNLIELAAATASAVDDFYNGNIIKILAGAGSPATKRILNYVGSTKQGEFGGAALGAAATTTSTYAIYAAALIYYAGAVDSNGIGIAQQAWIHVHGSQRIPKLIQHLSLGQNWQDYGTAAAISGTSITLENATGGGRIGGALKATNDSFNGMYVFVYSAGTGKMQYSLISDYVGSTRVATVDTWEITPATSILYCIVEAAKVHEMFYNVYAEVYVKAYVKDDTQDSLNALVAITDKFGNKNVGPKYPIENEEAWLRDVVGKGKTFVDYTRTLG